MRPVRVGQAPTPHAHPVPTSTSLAAAVSSCRDCPCRHRYRPSCGCRHMLLRYRHDLLHLCLFCSSVAPFMGVKTAIRIGRTANVPIRSHSAPQEVVVPSVSRAVTSRTVQPSHRSPPLRGQAARLTAHPLPTAVRGPCTHRTAWCPASACFRVS